MIVVEEKDGEYFIVPATSWNEKLPAGIQDDSCILNAGDHSFIKHKSWLDFRFAQAKPSIEILQGLLNGMLIRKEDLRPDLLAYIQAKTEVSDRLPSKFKYFFEKKIIKEKFPCKTTFSLLSGVQLPYLKKILP